MFLRSTFKHFFYLLCFVLLQNIAFTQTNTPFNKLVTRVNAPVSDTISGISLSVYLAAPVPKHGSVSITLLQSGNINKPYIYKVQYSPKTNYIGLDTLIICTNYINAFPYITFKAYIIEVYPSDLSLQPDFLTTAFGTPITIPGLSNDATNLPPAALVELPVSDHGMAAIAMGDQIQFVPEPGFSGIGHIQYKVCDASTFCRTGIATVFVQPNVPPVQDTLAIATLKNRPIRFILPYASYTLLQPPTNGSVNLSNMPTCTYTPAAGFAGNDQFLLSAIVGGNPTIKLVKIQVINTIPSNKMAVDDYFFTPKSTPATFDVTDNEIGNLAVTSWVPPIPIQGAISNKQSNGKVTFTPNPNFSGPATFQYRIGSVFAQDLEMAKVTVFVEDLEPSQASFNLQTPEGIPLVIDYQAPYTNFLFSNIQQPAHGTCVFYPGQSTHNLAGQSFTGTNLLIYTPTPGYSGIDSFSLSYCPGPNMPCYPFSVKLDVSSPPGNSGNPCVYNCLWPGDMNADGIVNHRDLLPLGKYSGIDGPMRSNSGVNWFGQPAANWNYPFSGASTDLKHVDSDGNGKINSADTVAIRQNYGKTSTITPKAVNIDKGLPFVYEVLNSIISEGDLVRVRVGLGTASAPVTDIYGFAFDVTLNNDLVDSAFQMIYYRNSWLTLDAPYLTFTANPSLRKLETAFTRINNHVTQGHGAFGELNFIVIEILDGARPSDSISVNLHPSAVMFADGSTVSGQPVTLKIPYSRQNSSSGGADIKPKPELILYPSPAHDHLNIHLNGVAEIQDIKILSLTGESMLEKAVQGKYTVISTEKFPSGTYFATVKTTAGVFTQKFQVFIR